MTDIEMLELAKTTAGGPSLFAESLGMTRQGLSKWKRIPAERVVDIERITGIPRYKLRPDLYCRGCACFKKKV